MMVFSALTIQHFFAANYPTSIWKGSFCDINTFFNCNSSSFSPVAQIAGVPLGYFGFAVGALVSLGAVFPSPQFERSNKWLASLNVIGVLGLLVYSLWFQRSLCPLCSGYYVFAILSAVLFWKFGQNGFPSIKHLTAFAVLVGLGAYGFREYNHQRQLAAVANSPEIVREFFSLPQVRLPSTLSPYWTVRSTSRFEDAPIRVVEYADFLCPDCQYLFGELQRLKEEFSGRINIAYQFFPLEARCNTVVSKDLHPGACDLAYMAAHDRNKFAQIHDEIFSQYPRTKDSGFRLQLARRYGVEGALTDKQTQDAVEKIIQTGAEYEKTSSQYEHGIRSTPTMIINNRMLIGTLPYEQLRAIFIALLNQQNVPVSASSVSSPTAPPGVVDPFAPKQSFMEQWQPTKPQKQQPKPLGSGGCDTSGLTPCQQTQ